MNSLGLKHDQPPRDQTILQRAMRYTSGCCQITLKQMTYPFITEMNAKDSWLKVTTSSNEGSQWWLKEPAGMQKVCTKFLLLNTYSCELYVAIHVKIESYQKGWSVSYLSYINCDEVMKPTLQRWMRQLSCNWKLAKNSTDVMATLMYLVVRTNKSKL